MKLLFDATFGEPWVAAVRGVLKMHPDPKPRIVAKYDIFDVGAADDEWIPKLTGTEWVIVSGDTGKGGAPRLPDLCLAYNRTHILLTSTVHGLKQFEKARAILGLWPKIMDIESAKAGSRFQIEGSANSDHLKLVQKSIGRASKRKG